MKHLLVPFVLLAMAVLPPRLAAHDTARITPLMTQPFADLPGREGLMLVVDYATGASDPVHRHDAHTFVYVLEGEIVMQVQGGEPVHLKPGQTFYESPTDIHVVGRNASTTQPAKFLVFFVKNQGVPPLTPVP
jgi:quercetin dioxygenase-like cupin family protein